MERIIESHAPFVVKIGVRIWNARRVPVGRRLAKWAVPDNAFRVRDEGCGREGDFTGTTASFSPPLRISAGESVVLDRRDIV